MRTKSICRYSDFSQMFVGESGILMNSKCSSRSMLYIKKIGMEIDINSPQNRYHIMRNRYLCSDISVVCIAFEKRWDSYGLNFV